MNTSKEDGTRNDAVRRRSHTVSSATVRKPICNTEWHEPAAGPHGMPLCHKDHVKVLSNRRAKSDRVRGNSDGTRF